MSGNFLAFWGTASLMGIVCLALILLPLCRTHVARTRRSRRSTNIEIYRQRCAEIDWQLSGGQLTQADAERAKNESGIRLLNDAEATKEIRPAATDLKPWLASILAAALIIFGGVLGYKMLGTPEALALHGLPSSAQMINALQARIRQNPADWRSRLVLASLQQKQGEYSKAARSLAYINRHRSQKNPDLLKAEAENRLAAGENLLGHAGTLFEQVLKARPDDIEALWYVGLKAAEAGQDKRAIRYWKQLLKQNPSDALREKVENRLTALDGKKSSL
jgi:cytochrome c-type biogenesis protein CcmH